MGGHSSGGSRSSPSSSRPCAENEQSMFGHKTPKIAPIEQKGLPLRDPKTIKKHNNKLKRLRKKHGVSEELIALEKKLLRSTMEEIDIIWVFEDLIM